MSLPYVLITPARNEEAFIELTIRPVVVQTVRPLRWMIISDGSTDGTDEIVKKYCAEYPWIAINGPLHGIIGTVNNQGRVTSTAVRR